MAKHKGKPPETGILTWYLGLPNTFSNPAVGAPIRRVVGVGPSLPGACHRGVASDGAEWRQSRAEIIIVRRMLQFTNSC